MGNLDKFNQTLKTVTSAANTLNKATKTKSTKKKTTAKKTTAAKTSAPAALTREKIVENLRLIQVECQKTGDKKTVKLFDKFSKLTLNEKPNKKLGQQLMDKLGALSDISLKVNEIIIK